MSYRRAHEPPLDGCPATVTVCTDYVALRHLGQKIGPTTVAQPTSDVERLVPAVVEFENEGIRLTAVNARVCAEELNQERRARKCIDALPRLCRVDVPLAIRRIVLLLVGGSTESAVIV